jgi:thiol-disulfide isomerase/thioredoxin
MNYITRVLLLTVSIGVVVDCNALADSPASGPTPSVGEAKNAAEQSSKPHEVIIQKDGASPEELSTFAKVLERAYAKTKPPESVSMLIAIAHGSQMGPGEGWFGPAQTRYTWEWLAKLHGVPLSEGITAKAFRGTPAMFERLDRNNDGRIAADDFDWSDHNPYVQQVSLVNRLFRRLDQNEDGRVTREELLAFFDKVSQGKDSFRREDFTNALIGGPSGFSPGDAPSPEVLVRGLFRGEIGSLNEGPKVNEPAPDFRLTTQDGSRTIRLSEQLGSKPIVLVFGNFTCGPFRSLYPMVEELCRRYRDDAIFLAVYVREAHPTDGWHMQSNVAAGVEVAQPQTYAERVGVAKKCYAKLKYTMPLLVDEIHDPVGNSYSGMPARLYVIDSDGKVAYKGGRGPFGFKSGEMEQALIMTLLDRHLRAAAVNSSGSAK